mgnify:FL=1
MSRLLDKEYREMYADIKPSGLLIAEVKEKMKKEPDLKKASLRKISLWCGSAAAVIAVVTMTVTTLWNSGNPINIGKNTSVFSSVGDSSEQSDSASEQNLSIPEWYKPGRLNVLALLQKTKSTGVSTGIKTDLIQPLGVHLTAASSVPLVEVQDTALTPPEGYKYCGSALVGDRFIGLYTANQAEAHFECSSAYYDIEQKTIICFSHQAKQMLSAAGVLTKDSVVNNLMENPVNGNCLVRITDNAKKTSYIYACNADGSVEKLDLPFGFSSSFSIAVNSDHSYGALALTRENNAAYYRVWIIGFSGEKITMKEINKINGIDYQTGEDLRFTPNDRYLIYNIPTGNGKLYHFNAREQWFAYDTQTGTSVRGSGKFLRYIHDGNAAILETTSGGKVIDLSTGEDLTRSTDLQDWEKMQVVEMPVRSASHGDLREITLENVFDSKQERVTVRKQVSAYLEKDGYIYSYLHREKNVECYSIQTGEKFTVPVSKKILDEVASYGEKYRFYYSLSLNKDGTKVFLSYYAEEKQPEPATESVSENIVLAFRDANSLSDMESYIRKNFKAALSQSSQSSNSLSSSFSSSTSSTEDEISSELAGIGVVRAEAQLVLGDGYSAVILRDSYRIYKVVVEDYRDDSFTMYQYDYSLDGFFTVYDDASLPAGIKFRKPLSAGANQQTTKKLYGDLPLAETMYDYAELYTNGKLDGNKVSHVVFNRIADKKLVTEFAIGAYTEDGGGRGASSCEDKTAMYNILKVLAKHDQYHIESDMAGFYRFWDPNKLKGSDTRYLLICSVGDYSRDVILGRDSNKKPFICYSDAYYYYITEQEYADLSSQCKQAAAQAKQEHDARTGG